MLENMKKLGDNAPHEFMTFEYSEGVTPHAHELNIILAFDVFSEAIMSIDDRDM